MERKRTKKAKIKKINVHNIKNPTKYSYKKVGTGLSKKGKTYGDQKHSLTNTNTRKKRGGVTGRDNKPKKQIGTGEVSALKHFDTSVHQVRKQGSTAAIFKRDTTALEKQVANLRKSSANIKSKTNSSAMKKLLQTQLAYVMEQKAGFVNYIRENPHSNEFTQDDVLNQYNAKIKRLKGYIADTGKLNNLKISHDEFMQMLQNQSSMYSTPTGKYASEVRGLQTILSQSEYYMIPNYWNIKFHGSNLQEFVEWFMENHGDSAFYDLIKDYKGDDQGLSKEFMDKLGIYIEEFYQHMNDINIERQAQEEAERIMGIMDSKITKRRVSGKSDNGGFFTGENGI